jgi:transposase
VRRVGKRSGFEQQGFDPGDQIRGEWFARRWADGAHTRLATRRCPGGDPLRLAFCRAHGRRKPIKAKPKKGSPIAGGALVRIAAFCKVEGSIRGSGPDQRRA